MNVLLRASLLLPALLVGCSVSFPQFEAAKDMVTGSIPTDASLRPFAWQLQWGSESTLVYAVQIEQGLYFTAEDTPGILYDGSFVLRADNLLPQDRQASIEVDESGTRMSFFESGSLVFETSCGPWTTTTEPDGTWWEKTCDGLQSRVRKLVSTEGAITRFEAPIHPGYPPVVLIHTPGGDSE